MAKQWFITFFPEMAKPFTTPAVRAGFDQAGDITGLLPAETLAQAVTHAIGWSLPSDERKPRVFRG